jgi:5-methyltetrahydropteroyltriglutamate--homocysteine methyltransferase
MNTQWRADHVGSLLRPADLIEARRNASRPDIIRTVEDQHILRVLAQQQELGFGIFTDGELRRRNFMSDFIDAVDGFDAADAVSRSWDATEGAAAPVSSVTGIVTAKLSPRRPMTAHETAFLREHSPGPIKVTLPSATQFPAISFKPGVTDRVYQDRSALLRDVVGIMKDELQRLKNEGVPYIQIDAPRYSYFIDPKWRDWIRREMGQEPDAVLDEYLRADNECFEAARKPGLALAIHLCRGNNRSHWYAEGGYDAIAEKLFNTLAVDRFLLEYDDERSGTFEPLRFVPRNKTVVLGLLSSKNPQLESEEMLLRRIDQASQYVPLENLALSPQCGFASTMEGNLLSEEEQWAKLRRVVEIATRVWGSPTVGVTGWMPQKGKP